MNFRRAASSTSMSPRSCESASKHLLPKPRSTLFGSDSGWPQWTQLRITRPIALNMSIVDVVEPCSARMNAMASRSSRASTLPSVVRPSCFTRTRSMPSRTKASWYMPRRYSSVPRGTRISPHAKTVTIASSRKRRRNDIGGRMSLVTWVVPPCCCCCCILRLLAFRALTRPTSRSSIFFQASARLDRSAGTCRRHRSLRRTRDQARRRTSRVPFGNASSPRIMAGSAAASLLPHAKWIRTRRRHPAAIRPSTTASVVRVPTRFFAALVAALFAPEVAPTPGETLASPTSMSVYALTRVPSCSLLSASLAPATSPACSHASASRTARMVCVPCGG